MPTIMRDGKPTYISVEKYNQELAEYRANVLGIDESTGKLKHYKVDDLGKIWINGQEFTGMAYQGLLTVNTKTYVEEPKRANDGSIPNINDYDTFVVPRCKVNFKYFNIQDYQRLCEATQSNEFNVKYYDKQFNEFVEHKMYCEPAEMEKLYNVGTDVFGVLDYEVSFIGTLNNLQTYTVTYDANGGTIYGNPQVYTATKIENGVEVPNEYKKGDRVFLEDNGSKRYFEAIYYENKFTPEKTGQDTILLTNNDYWLGRTLYAYSNTAIYNSIFSTTDTTITERQKEEGRAIAYELVKNDKGETIGRNYYIAIYNGAFSGRPLTDTLYWQKIAVKQYVSTNTYSSNKTSTTDTAYGQFVIENESSTKVYEATYYTDTFSGKDPTNTTYWAKLPLGAGIQVKWGKSIVVENPEELFNAKQDNNNPTIKYSADEWNTQPNGTGFAYFPDQSLNVYRNLTLYAQWKTKE